MTSSHFTYAAMEDVLKMIAASLDECSWRGEGPTPVGEIESRSGRPTLRVVDKDGHPFTLFARPEMDLTNG